MRSGISSIIWVAIWYSIHHLGYVEGRSRQLNHSAVIIKQRPPTGIDVANFPIGPNNPQICLKGFPPPCRCLNYVRMKLLIIRVNQGFYLLWGRRWVARIKAVVRYISSVQ